jgi:hypothetical protein
LRYIQNLLINLVKQNPLSKTGEGGLAVRQPFPTSFPRECGKPPIFGGELVGAGGLTCLVF